MINVLSLNNAHLGTTALELHAPLKEGRKRGKKRKGSTLLCIPFAARRISALAPSRLKHRDCVEQGDHCIPQLNDATAINTFSSQSSKTNSVKLFHLITFCFPMGEAPLLFRSYFVSCSTEYTDSSIYNVIDF